MSEVKPEEILAMHDELRGATVAVFEELKRVWRLGPFATPRASVVARYDKATDELRMIDRRLRAQIKAD